MRVSELPCDRCRDVRYRRHLTETDEHGLLCGSCLVALAIEETREEDA